MGELVEDDARESEEPKNDDMAYEKDAARRARTALRGWLGLTEAMENSCVTQVVANLGA